MATAPSGLQAGRSRFETVEQAEGMSQRVLPRTLFSALVHGSAREVTLRDNLAAFDAVRLRPRFAVAYPKYDTATSILGMPVALPVIAAPTSMVRLIHPRGELAVAAGVGASGSIYTVGWAAGYTLEKIAASASGPLWQNVVWRMGREGIDDIVVRAGSAGYRALVATIDLAIPAARTPRPPQVNLRTAIQFAPEVLVRPRWFAGFARDGLSTSKAVVPRNGVPNRFAAPTWSDLSWLRDRWSGGLVIKGILSSADAERALQVGADAIVVSNHGGKGVDGVPASLQSLPAIAATINGRIPILVDGGIRSGSDVVKAVAMGATAVQIGRPYLYGLAVDGARGVHTVFEVLREEIEEMLVMMGCPSITALDGSFVDVPAAWQAQDSRGSAYDVGRQSDAAERVNITPG